MSLKQNFTATNPANVILVLSLFALQRGLFTTTKRRHTLFVSRGFYIRMYLCTLSCLHRCLQFIKWISKQKLGADMACRITICNSAKMRATTLFNSLQQLLRNKFQSSKRLEWGTLYIILGHWSTWNIFHSYQSINLYPDYQLLYISQYKIINRQS